MAQAFQNKRKNAPLLSLPVLSVLDFDEDFSKSCISTCSKVLSYTRLILRSHRRETRQRESSCTIGPSPDASLMLAC